MDFYYANEDYVDFLQTYEKDKRGFTRVPNIKYNTHKKFIFGSVLTINDFKYYVPISSKIKKGEGNLLIRTDDNGRNIKGTMRFLFMFPIPDNMISLLKINEVADIRYKALLQKEYEFCKKNSKAITKKALNVYKKVTSGKFETLSHSSCDFKILEDAYAEFISNNKQFVQVRR